jgi:stress response protein YsnF
VTEQIQVEDTVRKERFEINTEGDVDLDNRDR